MRITKSSLYIAIALCANAGYADPAADQATLEHRLHEFLSAASRNDAAIHDAYWAPDLVYTSSSGTRFGKAELMKSVRDAEPAPEVLPVVYRAEEVDIRVYDDSAVVAFVLVADATDSEVDQRYLNTGTFLRRDAQWQAVAWQATKIPAPTDAAASDD